MALPTFRDDVTEVNPSQEDGFVRGATEIVGGPLGEHAATKGSSGRFFTPARIVLVLALLTFGLHWVQKSPCQDGAWQNNSQYTQFCYTDVLALYYAEELNEGKVPYYDYPVEYPVLTGYFMGALGLPVHALGVATPTQPGPVVLQPATPWCCSAFAVAGVPSSCALRRRRPWDAAIFALAPRSCFTATVNWDLLAVGLTAFGLFAWARRLARRRRRTAGPGGGGEVVAAVPPRPGAPAGDPPGRPRAGRSSRPAGPW